MLDFIRVNTLSSIRIKDEKVIYIDPFKIENAVNDADIFRDSVNPEITVVEKIEKY